MLVECCEHMMWCTINLLSPQCARAGSPTSRESNLGCVNFTSLDKGKGLSKMETLCQYPICLAPYEDINVMKD